MGGDLFRAVVVIRGGVRWKVCSDCLGSRPCHRFGQRKGGTEREREEKEKGLFHQEERGVAMAQSLVETDLSDRWWWLVVWPMAASGVSLPWYSPWTPPSHGGYGRRGEEEVKVTTVEIELGSIAEKDTF